jgi:gliding motility-associated lipoprotein GldH
MKKYNIFFIAIAIITVSVLSSCYKKTVYYRYDHTPISGWEKNDTLKFDIPPIQKDGLYQESIGLRVNGAYPFMGLCLIVEQTISNVTQIDTVNCSIINKDGYAKGNGISYYQYDVDFKELEIKRGDSIHVCIRHNMKREILPGISDIGYILKQK